MSSNVQEHHCVASTAPAPALRAAAAPLGAGRPAALGTLRWAGGAITHHRDPLGCDDATPGMPHPLLSAPTPMHATVTRSPILPGIFLSLNMRPGCWQLPVLPMTRCEREFPCVALPPLKFQSFMTPWKPLPLLVPHTSTSCPGTKCRALIRVPAGSSASADTRNSPSFRLGSTPALPTCPAVDLFTRLGLATPTPSCSAV
mmetsp:Transcript_19773/g.42981  ORF Transcript_19773/g.42981 Transcript_19773/m.42981 type:complete len:201 (+) Transcript_19773:213-815(+)